jgi:hypothetical protein
MKYSISGRQDPAYLEKADEIRIDYQDRNLIIDFAEKYPEAALVLNVRPTDTQTEISEIKDLFNLSKQKLTLCIPDIKGVLAFELKRAGIPYFWGYAVTTSYDLRAAVACGVSQVRIGAPLFFQQDVIKAVGVPARVIADVADDGYFNREDGVVGAWIRPEDTAVYEETVQTIEFSRCDKAREQALFRIYAEQHAWPGPVSYIISNIGKDATNRMIPPEFAEHRLNCGQRCQGTSTCRICYRLFDLADEEKLRKYLENEDNRDTEQL